MKLGVDVLGQLNIPGGVPSYVSGTTSVGLRYLFPGSANESEATAHGCWCEGWGVAVDVGSSSDVGFANNAAGVAGLVPVSFTFNATDAVAEVTTSGGHLRVTHAYRPSSLTPNLYEVTVTIENISGASLTNLRYRRNMDWDIEPTTFSEFTTIETLPASNTLPPAVILATNDGFVTSDPTVVPTGAILSGPFLTGEFVDAGPADHGASFDFALGNLPALGDSVTFTTFYGAAENEASALAALALVGADFYSFGQPNDPAGPSVGAPNTFVFAFKDVGTQCFELSQEKLICPMDGTDCYTWTFTLTNVSGVPVKYVTVPLHPDPSSPITVNPNQINLLLQDGSLLDPGESTQITLTICGGTPGDSFCLDFSLVRPDLVACCFQEVCVTLPACDCGQLRDQEFGEVACTSETPSTLSFTFSFTLDNLSDMEKEWAIFIPGNTEQAVFGKDFFFLPPLPAGGSTPMSVQISNAVPGEEFCFLVLLQNPGDNCCCAFEKCIVVPECPDPTGGADCCCAGPPPFGCTNPACLDAVCAVDPFCCVVAWDETCCIEAVDLCPDLCDTGNGGGPGDIDGDGDVDGADLGIMLGSWGQRGPADLNGDGVVNGADLGILLGNWG